MKPWIEEDTRVKYFKDWKKVNLLTKNSTSGKIILQKWKRKKILPHTKIEAIDYSQTTLQKILEEFPHAEWNDTSQKYGLIFFLKKGIGDGISKVKTLWFVLFLMYKYNCLE